MIIILFLISNFCLDMETGTAGTGLKPEGILSSGETAVVFGARGRASSEATEDPET